MAHISIDVDLEEFDLEDLIEELADRFKYGSDKKKDKIKSLIAETFQGSPIKVPSQYATIDEQSKRELIEEFIDKISYDQLQLALNSLMK